MDMRRYTVTEQDHKLIDLALAVLRENFDDGVYRHTVGCALRCKTVKSIKVLTVMRFMVRARNILQWGAPFPRGKEPLTRLLQFMINKRGMLYSPCGNAGQMLFEYCPDIMVLVRDEVGELIKVRARDLLPFAWEPVEIEL